MTILDENEVFDRFLTGNISEAAGVSDIVYMINQKVLEHSSCTTRVGVLTEVLHEIKLYLSPTENKELH